MVSNDDVAFIKLMREWCKKHPKKCGNDNAFFKNAADEIEDYQKKAKAAAYHPYPAHKLRESLTGIKTKISHPKLVKEDEDEKKKRHKRTRIRRTRRSR